MNPKVPSPRTTPLRRTLKPFVLQFLPLVTILLAASAGEIKVLISDHVAKPFGAVGVQVRELAVKRDGVLHLITAADVHQMRLVRDNAIYTILKNENLR